MASPFNVDVVSPEGTLWSGDAEFLVARTTEGEIGILAGHEPLMAALSAGPVLIDHDGDQRTTIAVHGGFMQVVENRVTLLTDRARITAGDRAEAAAEALKLSEGDPLDFEE
ncbi:MAG: F0F1 ATP synthase subunit epsilon [Acidimicrobiia bacterium]|nr:F0F1 ATP synthase subunit epsilon [Acidimicrobiia bacterium]MXY73891.1 F0F1 ATP synthase subunit epsilon [Acidimicrobiia bacterium]MYG92009.1 F0F1 ATP synthase subunit epsilon [Acidimicrobiia bacterium]MYH05311.1 F0F1 ATP synthase subunit epsilon [Acidimicrobiia bacterium]